MTDFGKLSKELDDWTETQHTDAEHLAFFKGLQLRYPDQHAEFFCTLAELAMKEADTEWLAGEFAANLQKDSTNE